MAKKDLEKTEGRGTGSQHSVKNEGLAKEEFNVFSLRPEEQMLYKDLIKLEGIAWKDNGTQENKCKSLVASVDYILYNNNFSRKKLSKPIVQKLCEVGEKNSTVAFVTQAFSENGFSKEGKEYYEEWSKTHKFKGSTKRFRHKMIEALKDQFQQDSIYNTLPYISFDHISCTIDREIDSSVRKGVYNLKKIYTNESHEDEDIEDKDIRDEFFGMSIKEVDIN